MKQIIIYGLIISSIVFPRRDCLKQAETDALGRSTRPEKDTFVISNSGHFYIHYDVTGNAAPNLIDNDANLLLSGESYKELLITNDNSNYFQSHTFVIGSHVFASDSIHQKFNNNVLVTLQFTHDHSNKQNTILLNELKAFIFSSNE